MVKNRDKDFEDDPNYILLEQESTKTDKERTINLPEKAIQALETLKKNMTESKDGYVMCTREGNPVRPRTLRNVLDAVLKRAGLKNAGLHSLRHTFASILFAKGVPVKIVSEILGHNSVQVTIDIYIHVIPDDKAKAMQLLDAANALEIVMPTDTKSIMEALEPLNSENIAMMMKSLEFLQNVRANWIYTGYWYFNIWRKSWA